MSQETPLSTADSSLISNLEHLGIGKEDETVQVGSLDPFFVFDGQFQNLDGLGSVINCHLAFDHDA